MGVSVTVKGTTVGTSTDAEGNFSIAAPRDAILEFSSVGFEPQEMPVAGRTVLNVTMKESQGTAMDEVVVIGYGTVQKKDLTGSVGKVNMGQIDPHKNLMPGISYLHCRRSR